MTIAIALFVAYLFVAIVNRRIGAESIRLLAAVCALLMVLCKEAALFAEQCKEFCHQCADSRMESEVSSTVEHIQQLEEVQA